MNILQNLSNEFSNYNLTDAQKLLVERLELFLNNKKSNCFLLKGYAGTGKTFITKGLTQYFQKIKRNYVLAAPTGKASKVIAKKTLSEAFTIHKTIYATQDIKEYKNNADDKTYKFYFDLRVNEDSTDSIYIIDEASMISNIYNEPEFFRFGSGFLLQDLLKYINIDANDHNKKIIFIGDNAQLPPIDSNISPALDLKYLEQTFGLNVEEYELTEVVRQKSNSGILHNVQPLRNALKTQIINQLILDTNFEDIHHLDHADFMKKYLEVCNNSISENNIVLAYTNDSVKEYNDRIREHFFPNNQDNIMPEDKIMVVSNNAQHEIFLFNGDFGIVKEVSDSKEQRHIVTKSKIIDVLLSFREVVILFEDLQGIPHLIRCKIIENLLYSDKSSLSSDENKALYVDFIYRNPHLKANTKEFKDALKSDPYFNALKIKFGYAITCHKAQGSEWENVLLNCASSRNPLSQDYFRWLYTAMTRTTNNLYLMNKPYFPINVGKAISGPQSSNESTPHHNAVENITLNTKISMPTNFLDAISKEVENLASLNDIKIKNIEHKSYHELYTFEYNSEISRIKIHYNGKNIVTKIDLIETNILSKLLKNILENLVHKIIYLEEIDVENKFEFSKSFLKEYFHLIENKLTPHGIKINNIVHLNYMERYTFENNGDVAIFDFYYNSKNIFTKFQEQKNSSLLLVKQIHSLLA